MVKVLDKDEDKSKQTIRSLVFNIMPLTLVSPIEFVSSVWSLNIKYFAYVQVNKFQEEDFRILSVMAEKEGGIVKKRHVEAMRMAITVLGSTATCGSCKRR